MKSQVKEKNIFFEQLMSRTWVDREELLQQRLENIKYIRFETDKMKYMQQRLR